MLIEGWGATTTGGAGGTTYTVTSLEWDAGVEGTLPWALAQAGPRIIQFAVAGVIEPPARFSIPNDTTLDGSTAPGAGVCIKGCANVGSDSPATWPSNIIISHMRFRPGGISEGDCLTLMGTYIVIDHCSLSWGNDEALGFKNLYGDGDPERYITVQWCMLAYSEKGCLCSPAGHKTTFHHNAWIHNYHRNPVIAGGDFAHLVDVRNNLVYDFGDFGTGFKGYVSANVVGNYMILREARFEKAPVFAIQDGDEVPADPSEIQLYYSGNSGPGTRGDYDDPYADEWEEVRRNDLSVASLDFRTSIPFDFPAVVTTSSAQAYTDVLAGAGATLPARDTYDARMVADVQTLANMGTYLQDPAPIRALAASEWETLSYADEDDPPAAVKYFVMLASGTPPVGNSPQDYTEYTEVDVVPPDYITVAETAITMTDWMANNVDVLVYKDFGAGHFAGDFEHELDYTAWRQDTGSFMGLWALANTVDDIAGLQAGADPALIVACWGGIRVWLMTGNSSAYQEITGLSINTPYYLTLKRESGVFTVEVYSDEARTVLVGSKSVADANAYRYLYGFASCNSGQTGDTCYGEVRNLEVVT